MSKYSTGSSLAVREGEEVGRGWEVARAAGADCAARREGRGLSGVRR